MPCGARAGRAVALTIEPGDRVQTARLKLAAENVEFTLHSLSVPDWVSSSLSVCARGENL